ncbi:MAG: hypothetical protein F6J93_13445 [Oscillatoria sp. SIO1A7]|nr:hypothetical protein [Oscillatoria sp. SIO1A7]
MDRGGTVWTVMYRRNTDSRPWLRIVTGIGGKDWPPEKRCREIAEKLQITTQMIQRKAPVVPGITLSSETFSEPRFFWEKPGFFAQVRI